MKLVALQSLLDNASFAILLVTMLMYWISAAFPSIPYLAQGGTAGTGATDIRAYAARSRIAIQSHTRCTDAKCHHLG